MTDDGYARSRDYFRAVAAVLLAGDIQARVVSNDRGHSIEVSLVDGKRVYWGNTDSHWAYSIWDGETFSSVLGGATGSNLATGHETLPWDVSVEDAARMIAMHDYPAPAVYPT